MGYALGAVALVLWGMAVESQTNEKYFLLAFFSSLLMLASIMIHSPELQAWFFDSCKEMSLFIRTSTQAIPLSSESLLLSQPSDSIT